MYLITCQKYVNKKYSKIRLKPSWQYPNNRLYYSQKSREQQTESGRSRL
nr:MAG TPA: hypothetical protein [Caudoviricetes sp.]